MANESNAGPYEIGIEGTLSPGDEEEIRFTEVAAGPADKKGYLKKIFGDAGGLDYIFVVNASGELISFKTKGGGGIIPSATSQTLDSGPYRSITVKNEGGTDINTGGNDQVKVEVGNGKRVENEREEAGFNIRDAAEDIVPGLNL